MKMVTRKFHIPSRDSAFIADVLRCGEENIQKGGTYDTKSNQVLDFT
jgi:hypothetical protein